MKAPKNNLFNDFPFETKLSLSNLIGFWELKAQDKGSFSDPVAKELMERLKSAPELYSNIEDLGVIERNRETVDWLMSAVLAPALIHDQLTAAVPPFKMETFYATKSFENLLEEIGGMENMMSNVDVEGMRAMKIMAAYHTILEQFYGITVPTSKAFIIPLKNKTTELTKYYKINITTRFCEITLKGDLPVLSESQIQLLLNNLDKYEIWSKFLPPNLFMFSGFALYSLIDITEEQITSLLKESLLKKDSLQSRENLELIQQQVKSLLELSDINVGLASFEKSRDRFIDLCTQTTYTFNSDSDNQCGIKEIYEFFSQRKETLILEDLEKNKFFGEFEEMHLKEGLNSLLVSPLFYGDTFLGIIKLASPKKGDLNSFALAKLQEVLPLFALALKQNSDENDNKVRAIIKETYTSIHPTVEWKFTKGANQMLIDLEAEGKYEPQPIVFNEVYPLYGATDIRGSSIERNTSIQADLTQQLSLAIEVLKKAADFKQMPALEELTFRLEKHKKRIKSGLSSGDEADIIEFLQVCIEPLFKNIAESCPDFAQISSSYFKVLDKDLGVVYNRRKAFEQSLTMINDKVTSFLDKQQAKAQEIFPHFFEKYVTDGVEYNIYIGDSLTEEVKYDPIFLSNLRLWQIIMMVEIGRRTERLKPELPTALDTTHLILVHSAPLSIRFRLEEKKFDVDGAYNIRYEIIKKRIDKSLIKDTKERLTQPGKIAIVYSNDRDADEYLRYIEFLQSKKFLGKEVEKVVLEDLQGVSGLKAIRISIRDDKAVDPKALEGINLEEAFN